MGETCADVGGDCWVDELDRWTIDILDPGEPCERRGWWELWPDPVRCEDYGRLTPGRTCEGEGVDCKGTS